MKKNFVLALFAAFLVIGFTGCDLLAGLFDSDPKIVSEYKVADEEDSTVKFYDDNTFVLWCKGEMSMELPEKIVFKNLD